jgi:hypothetical protein
MTVAFLIMWHTSELLIWRTGCELGVVSHAMWRNSSQIIWRKQGSSDLREAAKGDSQRSDLTNDQVLACGLNHCGGEMLELIDLEHSFHLGQQACN